MCSKRNEKRMKSSWNGVGVGWEEELRRMWIRLEFNLPRAIVALFSNEQLIFLGSVTIPVRQLQVKNEKSITIERKTIVPTAPYLFALLLRERISLFMLHVFLQIEECVKEYRRHFASLQVGERYAIALYRFNHVEHLRDGNQSFEKSKRRNRALTWHRQSSNGNVSIPSCSIRCCCSS